MADEEDDDTLSGQRLLDLTVELEEERRLPCVAEESLASSKTRLGHLMAFTQDGLWKRDDFKTESAA
ncbi:hypothetical protein ZWY2020_004542 [Hordeum vulgare]|nr:hypothetical protein ZWY2020_004542 [Hordeum vulgare]